MGGGVERSRTISAACGAAFLLAAWSAGPSQAQPVQAPYVRMAEIERYLTDRSAEVALARSAAPASVSGDAAVLVLGRRGYETAAPGKNGFTCLVERAWGADFDDPEFWNPKIRGPVCFNAAATRSVLPSYRKRTEWVLAGASKADLLRRTRVAVAAKEILAPEVGAMCYMMSKDGYLGDKAGGHWHPHLMFFLPRLAQAAWGSGSQGSPVFGGPLLVEPTSVFLVPVPAWSDGSPAPMLH